MNSEQHHDRLISFNQLREDLGGLSRASIYRHIKNLPGFPQPVKVGASTKFRQSDRDRYISSLGQDESPKAA